VTSTTSDEWSTISKAVFLAFCLIAATLIIYEHTIHVLGFLPFLFLLACPLMHLFMHRGHGHGAGHGEQRPEVDNQGGSGHA
jgi:hypothetical protein